jgi:hypothetical protein
MSSQPHTSGGPLTGARPVVRIACPMVDLEFLAAIPICSFVTRPELEAAEKLLREMTFAKNQAAPGNRTTAGS